MVENLNVNINLIYNWGMVEFSRGQGVPMHRGLHQLGAVHKVRHARGEEGVWEGVTVCDRGRVQEQVTSRLYILLSYIWNMKFKVMFDFLL